MFYIDRKKHQTSVVEKIVINLNPECKEETSVSNSQTIITVLKKHNQICFLYKKKLIKKKLHGYEFTFSSDGGKCAKYF